MKKGSNALLILLTFVFSLLAIGLSYPQLKPSQIWFVLALLAFALSLHFFILSMPELPEKIARKEGWQLAIIGTILALVDVGVPYLLLKNTIRFWANYLFWTVLTLFVLIIGIRKISRWRG